MQYFIFSILCYVAGIGSMAWLFWFLQFGMDRSISEFSWSAVLFNILLFSIFPLQHSILARPAIKERIQGSIPELLERPIYVGTSGIAMGIVIYFWRSFGPELYRFHFSLPFDLVFYIALILILFTLRTLDHHTMFGLRQGYSLWKKKDFAPTPLRTSGLFEMIRHPLTSLLIVMLWSHESMTAGRLELNILFTAYSLAGTYFEEKDLVKKFGDQYRSYRKRVPAFIPGFKR